MRMRSHAPRIPSEFGSLCRSSTRFQVLFCPCLGCLVSFALIFRDLTDLESVCCGEQEPWVEGSLLTIQGWPNLTRW